MTPEAFIQNETADRQAVMLSIHSIISDSDKTISPTVEPMMGKEMIIYKCKGMMKYGLASTKNHMTLHVLPMYGSKPLYSKYEKLLPKAKFQKGCINFSTEEEMPLKVVKQLFTDCSTIDLFKIRQEYLASKKKQAKKG